VAAVTFSRQQDDLDVLDGLVRQAATLKREGLDEAAKVIMNCYKRYPPPEVDRRLHAVNWWQIGRK